MKPTLEIFGLTIAAVFVFSAGCSNPTDIQPQSDQNAETASAFVQAESTADMQIVPDRPVNVEVNSGDSASIELQKETPTTEDTFEIPPEAAYAFRPVEASLNENAGQSEGQTPDTVVVPDRPVSVDPMRSGSITIRFQE